MTQHLVTLHGLVNTGCLVCFKRHFVMWGEMTVIPPSKTSGHAWRVIYPCETFTEATGSVIPENVATDAIAGGAVPLYGGAWGSDDDLLYQAACAARDGEKR
jgi:hypothetical protein